MRKLLIPLAAVSLFVTACGASTGVAAPAASTGETPLTNTIAVSGTGLVTGTPDTLIVDLGVQVLRPSVDEATGEAADLATAVIDALKAQGVAEKDIQTTNYSIYPEYDYRNDTQTLRGYRVSNTVSAKIRDLDKAGETIDAATKAGGNDAIVNNIRFDLEADGNLITAAREAAWNDAKAKAEQLASLAEVQLGKAVTISEITSSSPPPIAYGEAAGGAAFDTATPIQAGESQVTVMITVQFSIGG
ncbi:MAG: SIMPL domain-containing protein [Acidimicrobiales bacterium]|nr:SIMPL domain-containing protein [Acidimicrobiales bacterium]